MTDEQVNEITARAEMEYEMLKDRVHDLYEENKQLKEDKKKAIELIRKALVETDITGNGTLNLNKLLEILGDKE